MPDVVGMIDFFTGTFGGSDGRRPIDAKTGDPDETRVFCDGVETNGVQVPDLRGLVVRCSSDELPVGTTGGSATHKHTLSGSTGDHTLSIPQMPSHNHSINVPTEYNGEGTRYRQWVNTMTGYTGYTGGSQPHAHSLDGLETGEADNLPPYYVCAPVMYVGA